MMNRRSIFSTLQAALTIISLTAGNAGADDVSANKGFVTKDGTSFMLNGRAFYPAGANNHYLTFGSDAEVRRVLDDAVAMGANVIRTFIQPVIGSRDGVALPTIWDWKRQTESSDLSVNGNYMIYWDTGENRIEFNDGENGLGRLDFVIAEARLRGLKLIIAFLDFWAYTGGARQISAWYGNEDQNDKSFFFADARTKSDYRDWVGHVIKRRNALTGITYGDDPTIFAWELMNEPYAEPPDLYASWVREMSAYVKSLDPKHLVSSGHANVYNRMSDLDIADVDFGTWHGYPTYYKLSNTDFDGLIREFCELGIKHNKPVILEEFGISRSDKEQVASYARWLELIDKTPGCGGWLVWRLVSRQDSGNYPKDDHDEFDIRNDGGETWHVLKEAAARAQKIDIGLAK